MEKKEMLFLSLFLGTLFLGQLYVADRVIFGDDYIFATFAEKNQFFYTENAHPPLPVWTDILLTEIFPLTNRTIRLTSIIFATLTVGLVYFITRKIATAAPRQTAMLAAIITGLSAWHIRASQMNSGSDGGMFTFFFYLIIYFFLCWKEQKTKKWFFAMGIGLGLTLLTKETGFLLILILGFWFLIEWKQLWKEKRKEFWKEAGKTALNIGLVAFLVWSIFPLLDILYNNGENMHAIIDRINNAVLEKESESLYAYWFLSLYSLFKVLLWTGPFLLFLPLLWFLEKEQGKWLWKEKMTNIFLFIILIEVFFYFFATPPNLDRTRYLMIIIPALAILSAEWSIKKGKEWNITTKQIVYSTVLSLIFFLGFLSLNTQKQVLSYEGNENPLTQLKRGDFLFSLPVFTETDNAGFLLNGSIFIITYSIAGICFLILIYKKSATSIFLLFLSVSGGYNLIIAEEYGLHWTSPNYSNAIKEIRQYGQQNQLKEPIYLLKNYELQYYWRERYTQFISSYGISDTDQTKIKELEKELEKRGGTILFTDMPPIDKEGLLWKIINQQCKKDFVVEDKGIEIGYIFTC